MTRRFRGSGRGAVLAAAVLALLLFLVPTTRLIHYIYFDRSGLPDLERFIRFEIPTIGAVYDAQGAVLVELAREYRRVISYDEVPPVLRDASLAAEDRNFFTHSGTCHVPPLFTEPGNNLHAPSEIGVDSFQADRSPTHMYRTAPLAGLWTHQKGGFYHDGRFATLRDVLEHYDAFFKLELSERERPSSPST